MVVFIWVPISLLKGCCNRSALDLDSMKRWTLPENPAGEACRVSCIVFSQMETDERRIHARIKLAHSCVLVTEEGRAQATLRQLSRSGAQLLLADRHAQEGDPVELEIEPQGEGGPVELPALVVHLEDAREGLYMGVEFGALDDPQLQALDDVMGSVLQGSGGGAREHVRVARRIEVACGSAEETRAVMCDLSQGGLGLESVEPVRVGETLTVRVQLGGFPHPLQLQGTVVHVTQTEDGHYRAGLRFEELAPERRGVLRDLMQFMVTESQSASSDNSSSGD